MMCMTELHGGVCHRTSTPHKSGNKMKKKKKNENMEDGSGWTPNERKTETEVV